MPRTLQCWLLHWFKSHQRCVLLMCVMPKIIEKFQLPIM